MQEGFGLRVCHARQKRDRESIARIVVAYLGTINDAYVDTVDGDNASIVELR